MFDLHGYGPAILKGAVVTLEIAFLSLALALALGLLGATAKLSGNRLLRGLATVYTTLIRGVPDLVLMLLLFFGGQMLMNNLSDYVYEQHGVDMFFNINEFFAGVTTIGFIFGAYMTETFRGAFLAVDRGQIEAGIAYGMSRARVFYRIMLPQMVRHALPGLGNNWQVLLKTTALVSILGLSDMVLAATEAAKALHAPFKFFAPVAAIYLLLTALSEWGIHRLERRFSRGVPKESGHA
ncbi:MAG: ABC transporter permease [Gammaproteobacteria bacterium]|nr:ABC transporter permease [Gammaproteobacteria bacterium]